MWRYSGGGFEERGCCEDSEGAWDSSVEGVCKVLLALAFGVGGLGRSNGRGKERAMGKVPFQAHSNS